MHCWPLRSRLVRSRALGVAGMVESTPDNRGTTFLPEGKGSMASSDEMSCGGPLQDIDETIGSWVGRLTNSHPTQSIPSSVKVSLSLLRHLPSSLHCLTNIDVNSRIFPLFQTFMTFLHPIAEVPRNQSGHGRDHITSVCMTQSLPDAAPEQARLAPPGADSTSAGVLAPWVSMFAGGRGWGMASGAAAAARKRSRRPSLLDVRHKCLMGCSCAVNLFLALSRYDPVWLIWTARGRSCEDCFALERQSSTPSEPSIVPTAANAPNAASITLLGCLHDDLWIARNCCGDATDLVRLGMNVC